MREIQENAMMRSGNAMRQEMQPGQAKWFVGTMGVPGQERVLSVAREEWFEQGKNPTMANVGQVLVGKYGKPTKTQMGGPNLYNVSWAYDPLGRPITETSPLFNRCNGTADPNGGANVTPDCGVVVMAIVYSMRENPELSQRMQVGVVDQAGGYRMISATEQAFQQLDAQQRAKQVEEASKNANAPQL